MCLAVGSSGINLGEFQKVGDIGPLAVPLLARGLGTLQMCSLLTLPAESAAFCFHASRQKQLEQEVLGNS